METKIGKLEKFFFEFYGAVEEFLCPRLINKNNFNSWNQWLHKLKTLTKYFGLPNRRTCAFIYSFLTNRTCAGLLGTVRLFISAAKKIQERKRFVFTCTVRDLITLISNSGKENDLFWWNFNHTLSMFYKQHL